MIHHGDLFVVLPTLAAESIDACVTDPPYGIGFMGREWDTFKPEHSERLRERGTQRSERHPDAPNLNGRRRAPAISPSAVEYDRGLEGQRGFQHWTEDWAREVMRVLKPGGYLLVCGAPRSFHRMACGIEDAGFEVRDCFSWLFGSGFPKSLNLPGGLGTALKPAWEPIFVARKPFRGTVAANVLAHGTGALNVDACRIEGAKADGSGVAFGSRTFEGGAGSGRDEAFDTALGRWPANVVLDDEAAAMLDAETDDLADGRESVRGKAGAAKFVGTFNGGERYENAVDHLGGFNDSGGASRFYYVAKPSREERDFGCGGLAPRTGGDATDREDGSAGLSSPRAGAGRTGGARNVHPTVKPIALMRWLIRLVTPIGGVVLDPFVGSGTTGMACRYEMRGFVGVEREADYVAIAERRIAAVAPLFGEMADV